MWIIVILILVVGWVFWQNFSSPEENSAQVVTERVKDIRAAAMSILSEHLDVLVRKRRMLAPVDEYGIREEDKWLVEAGRFVDRVLLPNLPVTLQTIQPWIPARQYILEGLVLPTVALEEAARMETFAEAFDENMTGIEYEHICAERLRLLGWKAYVTKGSGDQGADVIANRDGETVVLQCKKYNAPVGNSAIQEASAALRHYGGTIAVVVAPNGFTKSAYQLADSNEVILLSHDDFVSHPKLADNREISERHSASVIHEPEYVLPLRKGWWQRTFGT